MHQSVHSPLYFVVVDGIPTLDVKACCCFKGHTLRVARTLVITYSWSVDCSVYVWGRPRASDHGSYCS